MTPPETRRRSSWRVVVGVACVLVAAACAVLSRDSLLAGHPAYPLTLVASVLLGLLLVGSGVRRVPADRPYRRVATGVGRFLAAVATVVVLGGLVYLVPMSATPAAIAATASGAAVTVTDSPTRIVLGPTSTPQVGLVFYPGAKVDPRAYVPLLRRVAAAGYLVVVLKVPYDVALLAVGAARTDLDAYPQVTRWAVGGHSLGGVAAAMYASDRDPRVVGLLFWASYPATSLADRTDLTVASVSGTADGLSTPSAVAASRADLPPATVYTAVEGAVHGYFGDYGEQPGDGTPTVDRETAQTQIVTATTQFLGRLAQR